MKVFFSCTTYRFEEYQKYYYEIRDYIADTGNVITHDWLQTIRNRSSTEMPSVGKNEYKHIVAAIEDSDALIFESTLSSFSTGHLLTIGVQLKKPILVMWLDSSPWVNRKGFIEGIESANLDLTSYNNKNYKDILRAFLRKYSSYGAKHRFNLVLDDPEWQYLEWLNYRSFKTRSKILREVFRRQLEEDAEYCSYLSKENDKKH
jgi:hypothetical protein